MTSTLVPRYGIGGAIIDGEWVDPPAPPYAVMPLIKDLLLLELYERGGSYIAALPDREIPWGRGRPRGAVRRLVEEVLPGVTPDFSQIASGAAGRLEKRGWLERNHINPHTGHYYHSVVKLVLLRRPSAEQLAGFRRSRRRLIQDFTVLPTSQ